MLRVAVVFAVGCTGFVKGPPTERTGVEVVECTDSYALPAIDVALWAGLTSALIYAAKTDAFGECGGICPLIPALGVATAIAMPIVATHGFERVHACRAKKQRVRINTAIEEERARKARERERAWVLTKQAAIAARAGNCDAVRESSAAVRAADEDFYATVFVRDVAIARCL